MSNMKLIISKNNDTWTGILLNKSKLYFTAYHYKTKEEAILSLSKKTDQTIEIEEFNHPIIESINNIINGTNFSIPNVEFDFTGYTEKETKILKTLNQIPAGETISYGELAKKSGFPNAARFVGNVMAKNRFAPIIPCHRVILSSGKLGHFSGNLGPKFKKKLLVQEGISLKD